MYYYYDGDEILRGPFSESAYAKWLANGDIPHGKEIYNLDFKCSLVEDVVRQLYKSRTKVMFCEESFSMDKTCDRTDLDITLLLENTDSYEQSSDDFTQIEEGVDEIDRGMISEKDMARTHLQKMIDIYFDRRSLNNQRRHKYDHFVPFEYPWTRCFPYIMKLSDVMRGAVHTLNQLQCYDEHDFSIYLETLNIKPHQCFICQKSFPNSYRMLEHFLSVIHINRAYDADTYMSMIDINSTVKIMNDFEIADRKQDCYWVKTNGPQEKKKNILFDVVDINTALESMKSTVALLGAVPLLRPPSCDNSGGTCEYIEFILLLREFEAAYYATSENVRDRRFGANSETKCLYCNLEFDATSLKLFTQHLFSEQHIRNSLQNVVSRNEMEYWIAFLQGLGNRNQLTYKTNSVSLQEGDFPLCYNLVDLVPGDFIYSGEDLNQVLNFVRKQVQTSEIILEDVEYHTSCRWCHLELRSRNSVIRHILYDKCHTDRLQFISNDDLRRFFRLLEIQVTIPLFRMSFSATSKSSCMDSTEKEKHIQRLQNLCYRVHKKRRTPQLAAKSFPFGLVNRCDLCQENIEHVDGILAHFCSIKHTEVLMNNFRMTIFDFDYWLEMFNVRSHAPQIFYF
ncbi:unnamed protein product [Caenorhabditis brenneri]